MSAKNPTNITGDMFNNGPSRFDFEQSLMHAWHVVDDIKLARKLLEDMDLNPSDKDTLDTLLLGYEAKYNIAFNYLLDDFFQLVKNKKI